MALHWQWSDKCGEITMLQQLPNEESKSYTIDLYEGNAYLIMIHEFTDESGDDRYELFGFFNDKEHMKNCLGLNPKKGYSENIYNTEFNRFTKLRLDKTKHRRAKEIITAFAAAFDEISIELYSEEVAS